MNAQIKKQQASKIVYYIIILIVFAIVIFKLVTSIGWIGREGLNNLNQNSCTSEQTFSCANPVMHSNGTFSFTFAEDVGTLYNVHLACSSIGRDWQPIANNTPYYELVSIAPNTRNNSLVNNQHINITDLPCYGQNGTRLNSQTIGQSFTGYVWINYTIHPQIPSTNNSWTSLMAVWIHAVNVT